MQRHHLWTSLCLCGFLTGCGFGPECGVSSSEESDSVVEKTEAPPKTSSSKTGNLSREELPPAPMPTHKLEAKILINKPAPEFVVEKWLTKEPDRKGKMVMIDFWATWCDPCIRSIPKLNQFHRKYEDRLAVVGVSYEPAETVRQHPGAKINYALAIDPKRRMNKAIQNEYIPYIVLIDPTGVVRWQGLGSHMTEDVLDEMLDTYVP